MTTFAVVIVTLVLLYIAGYIGLRMSGRLLVMQGSNGETFLVSMKTPAVVGIIYRPLMLVEWRFSYGNW